MSVPQHVESKAKARVVLETKLNNQFLTLCVCQLMEAGREGNVKDGNVTLYIICDGESTVWSNSNSAMNSLYDRPYNSVRLSLPFSSLPSIISIFLLSLSLYPSLCLSTSCKILNL